MGTKCRLYYLDDIPTPYRLGVLRIVAQSWNGALRVGFCAESEPGRAWELDYSGVDHEFLDGRQWRPAGQTNPFSFKWNPRVIDHLERFAPDVVVLSGYAHPTMIRAACWCLMRGIPYAICSETSHRSSAMTGWRWLAKRYGIGWMVRNMAFGLPVGREAADYFRALGADRQEMYFFPNTPDTSRFEKAANWMADLDHERSVRRELGLADDKSVLLFVGRLISAKRPLDAIAAFKGIAPHIRERACLVVVGDGDLMTEARAAAEGDADIIFTGWLADPDAVARLMALASAMILPSGHEPWGAVVNEAMASKTCVIATENVGAAHELIDHGVDGFVVAVGDVGATREAMQTLINDPERRSFMGASAQAKAIRQGAAFAARNLIAGATSVQ